MNKTALSLAVLLFIGCASQKGAKKSTGDTRTQKVEQLDEKTYLLKEQSDDISYAFSESNPVKVGGVKESNGPLFERMYLNALLGPNGEKIKYFRVGSCCAFKTPNGFLDDTGLLDLYKVYWEGSKDTLSIYINMYDKGDLKIPVGLTARK